jgi:hypothetical protein
MCLFLYEFERENSYRRRFLRNLKVVKDFKLILMDFWRCIEIFMLLDGRDDLYECD